MGEEIARNLAELSQLVQPSFVYQPFIRWRRTALYNALVQRLRTLDLSLALESLLAIADVPLIMNHDDFVVGATKAGQLTTKALTARAINARVGDLGQRIGVAGLSPHDLRHWWATAAMRGGTDVAALQDAGGWSSPAMPLRYAEVSKIANERVKLD